MRNLIPERIIQNLLDKKYKDNFKCFSMFVDISGFTSTTEALMKHGQEGAEVLSDILRYLFDTTVKAVYDHGGYVTKYAGDAFTAIYEIGDDPAMVAINVLDSALITNKFFSDNKIYRSKFGDFEFGVKVGMAYGDCSCGIVGGENEKTYYFSGSAVDLCAMAEHNASKGEIWMSETIYTYLKEALLTTKSAELYGMKFYQVVKTKDIKPKIKIYKSENFDKKYIYHLAGKLESEFPVGEFRNVISVFISFSGNVDLEKLMSKLYELKETFGASHPVMDFGDKGGNILLFFGAPISYENNSFRAQMFILNLTDWIGNNFKIRAGLAKGVVYCGFNGSELRNEFTCLGNTVNQSARFMMKADWGQVLVDKELSINENFVFTHIADIQYKGREGLIPTYKLDGKAEIKDIFFKGSFVGRDKEKIKIRKFLLPLSKSKFCGVLYVNGEAGVGKSRLTNQIRQEIVKEFKNKEESINWFYFACDEIIKAPYNPFKYFFQRYFDFNEDSTIVNTEKFEKKFEELIKNINNNKLRSDLISQKDYISYFLELTITNLDIVAEEPNERQNNVIISLINLFKCFAENSSVVLEVDNAASIDSDSIKLFSRLSIALKKLPFALIFNCRFKDNGEIYDFEFQKQKNINLKVLNKSEFKELAKDRLKLKSVPKETLNVLEEKSRRNPLFLEQIIIYIRDNSILDSHNKIKNISSLPSGINQIILARIDKLHTRLKEILKTASCIGNEVPFDLISYLFMNKYTSINKSLAELENEDILILFSEINYLFKFGVIRDVIYDMQLKKTVREVHELIGEAIEKIHNENIEKYFSILAYHYENAENIKKALEYHTKAGFQAKNNYQNSQALFHFDKANILISAKNKIKEDSWEIIDVKKFQNEVREYIRINFERFYFYFAILQDIQKSSKIIETVLFLANSLGDKLLISFAHIEKSLILSNQGQYDESNIILEDAIIMLDELNLPYKISLSQLNIGKNHFMVGKFDKALEYYNKALASSERIEKDYDREKIKAKIYGDLGIANDYSGNFEKALEFYNMQLEITEKLNLKMEKAAAVGNIGVVYHLTGNLNKAEEFYEKKLKLSEEMGRRLDLAQILNNMGFLYKDLKNYTKAISFHKKSYLLSLELSDFNTMASAIINLGHVYKIQKNYLKAEAEYIKGIEISKTYNFKHSISEGMIELGEMYYLMGKKDLSKTNIEEGLKIAEQISFAEYIEKGKQFIGNFFLEK